MKHLTEEGIREVFKDVRMPASNKNILEAELISKIEIQEKSVFVELILDEHNPMVEKSLRYQMEKALHRLDPEAVLEVEFKMTENASTPHSIGTMMAVGSGKGGVGKSSMTVNLGVAFQNLGYTVGILDCDIYGPSIPMMLGVMDQKPFLLDKKIQPIEVYGLKVISAGFLVEPGQSLIWRGPMIHKLIQQFVNDVNWGSLDILLVDLPPGTGDAPLSLSQVMPLTGAIMVSMPQQVSILDVHKGISMFNRVKVPILGVIENMSHFICPSCQHEENIFDRGGVKKFCLELGVPYLGDVPLEPQLRATSDAGRPFMLDYRESKTGQALESIAKRLQPFIKTSGETDDSIRLVL